jgi:hypothetical protein
MDRDGPLKLVTATRISQSKATFKITFMNVISARMALGSLLAAATVRTEDTACRYGYVEAWTDAKSFV